MPTNTLDGHSFDVNDEGFFTDPAQWSEELATALAALIDIEMDEAHWAPIRFMRTDYESTGATPTLNRLKTAGGFDIKELFQLYPGKPAKKMAWIAGLPKPANCV